MSIRIFSIFSYVVFITPLKSTFVMMGAVSAPHLITTYTRAYATHVHIYLYKYVHLFAKRKFSSHLRFRNDKLAKFVKHLACVRKFSSHLGYVDNRIEYRSINHFFLLTEYALLKRSFYVNY